MKLVLFGSSLLISGSIMFSASFMKISAKHPLNELGVIAMILGAIIAIAGCFSEYNKG